MESQKWPEPDLSKSLLYLASPYSHHLSEIMESRYESIKSATAWLILQDNLVFSPILHTHDMAKTFMKGSKFSYWQELDLVMLSRCNVLVILTLEGWEHSVGVDVERRFAKHNKIPIIYLKPSYINYKALESKND